MTTAARGQKVRAPVLLEPPLEEVGLGTPRISTMLMYPRLQRDGQKQSKAGKHFLSSTKADLNRTYCRSQFRAQANSAQLVTANYLVSNTADTTILEAKLCTRIM